MGLEIFWLQKNYFNYDPVFMIVQQIQKSHVYNLSITIDTETYHLTILGSQSKTIS